MEGRLRHALCVESRNDLVELCFLIGVNLRELDPEGLGLDPPHLSFVDAERPIKSWNIDAALERRARDHRKIRFNHAATGREVYRPTLTFSLPARKCASEL